MNRRNAFLAALLLSFFTLSAQLSAQQPPPPRPSGADGGQPGLRPQGPPPPRGPGQPGREGRGGGRDGGPSADLQLPPGRFWDDPNVAQNIGLTAQQIKKMDEIFNGSREHLIDLDAAVQKAEAGLEPLLEADPIDRAKIMSQIERLTQAKAELEKTSAQMLLDVRLQLTHDQWAKLSELRPPHPPRP